MNGSENDRFRGRMAGSEVVEKFLTEVVGGIDIEHKKVGLGIEDQMLRLLKAASDLYLRFRNCLPQSGDNFGSKLFRGFQHEDPPRRAR
jgi:hypothetical protein